MRLNKVFYVLFIISIQFNSVLFSQSISDLLQITPSLRDPIKSGALTPISFYSTRFEPDSAFILPRYAFSFDMTVRLVNVGELSTNNRRYEDGKDADFTQFSQDSGRIYSVYADLEYIERKLRFAYGIYDNLELEMILTDYSFQQSSNLDNAITLTHDLLGNSNKVQKLLDEKSPPIYIVYDNETGEIVYQLNPLSIYSREIITFNLKWQFHRSKSQAISFNVRKDVGIGPHDFEETMNRELDPKGYDSTNYAINYTALFDFFTIHAAYSETSGSNQFLPKSPQKMIYEFYGINIYTFFNTELGFQFLKYTSPFPKDTSSIGDAIEEYTVSLTYWLDTSSNITFGFLENNKQGPRNIDIGLLTNIKIAY